MKPGDRVVHHDAQWYEYETVTSVHDMGDLGRYLFTNGEPGDWEDNFRLYEPGGTYEGA